LFRSSSGETVFLPKVIRDLFRIDTNPVVSIDEEQIPKTCAEHRSRVILDNQSAAPVLVHYRKQRRVVSQQL
jgi:hypothetical protein